MHPMHKLLAVSLLAVTITACAAPRQPRIPERIIERALANAPGEAQPGKIVATETAFARAAREEGQWTAFTQFSAPDAVLHGRNGPIQARPWLASLDDPAKAVDWAPRSVWMSCDGKIAVSQGRFRDPEGLVGTFITVWERQDDLSYRWVYDIGSPDDPQPEKKPQDEAEDDAILVQAGEVIQGYVADCLAPGEALPAAPMDLVPNNTEHAKAQSPDGTLRWRWEHGDDGSRRVVASYFSEGEWRTFLDRPMPVGGGE